MSDLKLRPEISFAQTFLCSAFAACFAELFCEWVLQLCTIPLDTAKVRLQLQKKTASGDGVSVSKYRGLMGTVVTIAREEGLWALWNGVIAGLHRQCIYGGLRIGLYDPVKTFLVGSDFVGDIPLYQKIFAALLTGAIAIVVANPTDLVKVRLQAEGKLPSGVPRRYYGALDAYCTIVRQEGLGALWTGLGPNIARNAIVNAAELASYDQVKETILKIPGFTDNIFTHILAGLGAGLFAVCIGSPIDVVGFLSPLLLSAKNNSLAAPNISISLYRLTTKVKSRMMGDSAYKNTVDCFIKTLKYEIVPFFTDLLACIILYERQLAFFQ
ncbi:mitochondrial uncoupling protein 2 [Citrus sinensis]|uniref:Mitochondrial uncoupling protein 2 n=1 Tax=Citrus sinensis TaxID=2711 RepID=A0ACB8IWR0_CITSI|nr:mitochondrial uncoupling protein 2 [Citrus sinensis]